MTAAVLIPLIAQYGIPWVTELIKLIQSNPNPTPDQWLTLLQHPSLTKSYDQWIDEAKAKAGVT